MNSAAQLSAAQQLASSNASAVPNLADTGAADDDEVPELEAVEEEGPVDETGVDPKDIELVIQQVGCSRAKAVKVLKESGGDLINASASSSISQLLCHLICLLLQSWRRASDRTVCLMLSCTSTTACFTFQKHPLRVYPHSPALRTFITSANV